MSIDPTHRCRGFSIIELIVAIAVIVILISLLAPALRGTRDAARDVTLASAMRQLGQAVTVYSQGFDELFPYIATPGAIDPDLYGYTVAGEDGAPISDPDHEASRARGLYFDFNARFWLTALRGTNPQIVEFGRQAPTSERTPLRFARADGRPLDRCFASLTFSSSATAELWTPLPRTEGVGDFAPSAYTGMRITQITFPSDKSILVGPTWPSEEAQQHPEGLLACTMADGSVRGIDIISDDRFAGTVRRGAGRTAGPWITPEGVRGRDVPLATPP